MDLRLHTPKDRVPVAAELILAQGLVQHAKLAASVSAKLGAVRRHAHEHVEVHQMRDARRDRLRLRGVDLLVHLERDGHSEGYKTPWFSTLGAHLGRVAVTLDHG
jgi:hypothetical protein